MKDAKYLLYIDILGFSELVRSDTKKIKKLFTVIDSLNAHDHNDFKTLVFSDTILIFNNATPVTEHDHEYFVMFACEFIQDLMFKTIDLDIQFRAILTYDQFYYHNLKNMEAYYGTALVNCYYKEKEINALGLFIDKRINKYNKIFRTTEFDNDLNFVYLLQTIEFLHMFGEFDPPIDEGYVSAGYDFFGLQDDVKTLKNIYSNITLQKDSKIRGKYLETYYQYQKRYKWLMALFENSNFDHTVVSPNADWTHLKRGHI
ncbi:hypothetical protein [Pedobacter paludis]|uniref:DUF2652 domain-containing protein n=1 Tax=Pedobacter paludis TaxID=2203212 RepID=A0A317EWF5_9SPHI|nr:hypothetical protein [Pedobacter paludis]PWS31161.1 hypothetical protein DF947_11155 [Pedobacter paludis]